MRRAALARMNFMATTPPSLPPTPPVRRPAVDDSDSVVLERRTQRTEPPRMYQVLMLNDDYTPMEFVVVVLQEFFGKDRENMISVGAFDNLALGADGHFKALIKYLEKALVDPSSIAVRSCFWSN